MDHHKRITSEAGLNFLARVREICTRLPEVAEAVDGFGHTSFRVMDKPFVMMGENEAGAGLSIKVLLETQEILLQRGDFEKTHYIGRHGWVTLRDTSAPNWQELEELILEGYLRTAPKRLAKLIHG